MSPLTGSGDPSSSLTPATGVPDDTDSWTDGLDSANHPRATLKRLSEIIPSEVTWLWKGFIAIGKLTLVVGDPGLGKSFLSLDLAARVSQGMPWPDGSSPDSGPASVILISAEDGHEDTIHPRLSAAGADMEKITIFVEPLDEEGKPEWFNLKKHISHLEWAIRQRSDTKLIVIDPLTAFGGGVDERSQGAVREMLQPLVDMATKLGVAVLVISHPNKSEGGKAAYRTTGSLAYNAVARAVWFVIKDALEPERRFLLPVKNNLANDSKGLAYRIVGGKIEWEPDPILISADDALAAEAKARQRPSEMDRAVVFLKGLLEAGAMWKDDVVARGKVFGFAVRTLERAKKESSIGDKRLKTEHGVRSFWHLSGRMPTSLSECQLEDSGPEADEECQNLEAPEPRSPETIQEEKDWGGIFEDNEIPI